MDRARHDRSWPLQAAGLGAALAAMIAIAAFVGGAPTTGAVAQAQAATPVVEAFGAVGGNGPTGYFPDQFVNLASEITEHIEAF